MRDADPLEPKPKPDQKLGRNGGYGSMYINEHGSAFRNPDLISKGGTALKINCILNQHSTRDLKWNRTFNGIVLMPLPPIRLMGQNPNCMRTFIPTLNSGYRYFLQGVNRQTCF
jgi:hypothetical protein